MKNYKICSLIIKEFAPILVLCSVPDILQGSTFSTRPFWSAKFSKLFNIFILLVMIVTLRPYETNNQNYRKPI